MSQEWDRWAARHLGLFGLTSDADARMLKEWADLFARAGYLPAELTEATEWLVTNAPPKFRTEHLAALQERLRDQRRRAELRRPAAEPGDRGTCVDCRGAGLASVPNPKALRLGRWATMAVTCNCVEGRAFKARNPNWLTLHQYEQARPDWRREAREHDAALLAEANAARAAGDLDRALGPVLSRALARRPQPAPRALPGPGAGGGGGE